MKLLIRPLLVAANLALAACSSKPNTEIKSASTAVPADTLTPPPSMTTANIAPTGEADFTGPTAPHATEQELIQSGAYAALNGIQFSQLALTKDLSADMKEFAARILKDYTRSLTFLKPAADKAGVKIPTGLDAAHKKLVSSLANLKGKDFEIEYVAQAKANSQLTANTLAAYRQLVPTQAEDLQTWIGVTLPIAKNHLGMVMEIEQGKTKL